MFMVEHGLSPFSLYPRCDVCSQATDVALIQVGRWMIHPDCYEDNLETLKLPAIVYPRSTRKNWDPHSILGRMGAHLRVRALYRLRALQLDRLLADIRAGGIRDVDPIEPPRMVQLGPSGRVFDTSKIERIRAQVREAVLA
jgi:hypothetical protein